MEIQLGSNSFRNTNGVLALEGKAQLVLEMPAGERQIFVTMDLYGPDGKHIGHVRRNQWAFNDEDRFRLETGSNALALFAGPAWLKISDARTGEGVLEVTVAGPERVRVTQGRFYTHKGHTMEITEHVCRIVGVCTWFNDVADVRGGPVELGAVAAAEGKPR